MLAYNMLMQLLSLEERQSEQEKKMAEAQSEEEIITIIKITGSVIISLLTVCQLVTSLVFFWHSRKINQIKWLPKFIMILANIQTISWSSYNISAVFIQNKLSDKAYFWRQIVPVITNPLILGSLIRFQRVQVQLQAQEENTIKVLSTIKRATILEKIIVMTLVIA